MATFGSTPATPWAKAFGRLPTYNFLWESGAKNQSSHTLRRQKHALHPASLLFPTKSYHSPAWIAQKKRARVRVSFSQLANLVPRLSEFGTQRKSIWARSNACHLIHRESIHIEQTHLDLFQILDQDAPLQMATDGNWQGHWLLKPQTCRRPQLTSGEVMWLQTG
jgi:hypothetical protein